MKKIYYSIIIPHKDIPCLLQRCLDSIPYRDDLEVIVVDDNSDSSIVDFDNFPGVKRSDVSIIFLKEGKGAGYARNVGMKKAKGKWLLFADADDYFASYLSVALDIYKESNYELIYFKVCSVYSDTLLPATRGFSVNLSIDNFLRHKINSIELGLKYCVPWGKMIRNEIVMKYNLQFSETKASNDVVFGTRLALCVNNMYIGIDVNELYCITLRHGSLTTTPSIDLLYDRLNERLKRNNILIDAGYRNHIGSVAYLLYCIYKCAGLHELIKAISIVKKSTTPLMTGYKRWLASIIFIRKHHIYMSNIK